jgi:hypothetical protein
MGPTRIVRASQRGEDDTIDYVISRLTQVQQYEALTGLATQTGKVMHAVQVKSKPSLKHHAYKYPDQSAMPASRFQQVPSHSQTVPSRRHGRSRRAVKVGDRSVVVVELGGPLVAS